MERISYDFSSSDEDMSSSCSDETANRRKFANSTDKDEESVDKVQNVVYKLVNREVNEKENDRKITNVTNNSILLYSKQGSFRIINELNRNRMPIAQCQID